MNAPDLDTRTIFTGSWGKSNAVEVPFKLANGDNIGSTHDLLIVPPGFRPRDATLIVTTAANANVTANIGLVARPGESTAQDDIDYFFATAALSTAAVLRKSTTTLPFTVNQPMNLRLAVAGANVSQNCAGLLIVEYEFIGNL